ncbi:MAG: hypothetical protein LQ350_001415 [Teloschistes chrysophthalmus]|nr:MAG: hypothetical protein LQ350_001415 [Niorma chrysophthalma]
MSLLKALRGIFPIHRRAIIRPQYHRFTTWFPVQRLQESALEVFQKTAFDCSLPAQLSRNTFENFPALTKWFHGPGRSFHTSYLRQFGDVLIPIELTSLLPSDVSGSDTTTNFERAEAPFNIFLSWAEQADASSPQRLYVAQAPVARLPTLLQDDLPTPDLVVKAGKGDVYDTNIWLGVAPTYTPLHRDPNPNMYLQLAGQKKIRLLDPDAGLSVFSALQALTKSTASSKFRGDEMMKGMERRLLEKKIWPDEASRDMTEAVGFEAILGPGESLFIPQGWWHSVKSIGEGCTGSVCDNICKTNA